MMRLLFGHLAAALWVAVFASAVSAQTGDGASGDTSASTEGASQTPLPQAEAGRATPGAILVLNQDALLFRSAFGQRIQQELEAASQLLAAENRDIEAQLTAEELRLTEQRQTMPVEEFRPLAEDFNDRVEAIRATQDAKSRALTNQAEAAQGRFFELAFPILLDIVQRRGASVLMDSRSVLLSADGIDITDEAVARINAEIGAGGDAPLISLDEVAPASGQSAAP